jgi:hypothetical protein
MNIALRVLSGPLEKQKIPIDRPMTVGRLGDIALDDPKVSGIHAHIEQSSSGKWVIKDNESKNGIRVKEERMKAFSLKPGVVFHIGDSSFEVIDLDEKPARAGEAKIKKDPAKSKKKHRYWYEALASFLLKNKSAFKDRAIPLTPLDPAVVLEFVRGPQMNSRWILGYGPRKLGSRCVDLPIFEPEAPDVCFELRPSADGILFKTDHPDVVRLNNEKMDSQVLRVGDTISIFETLIEVDFTE